MAKTITLLAVLSALILAARAGASVPITCPEWAAAQNPYKEGSQELLSATPIVAATSTEKGLYEAHIDASDYEAVYFGQPKEVQVLTWAIDYPHETHLQRITVLTGLNGYNEADIKLTGLHPGRWETIATAVWGGYPKGFDWVPFHEEPISAGACETLGGVGGTEVH